MKQCHNCKRKIPKACDLGKGINNFFYFKLQQKPESDSIYFCNLECLKKHYGLKEKIFKRRRGVTIYID